MPEEKIKVENVMKKLEKQSAKVIKKGAKAVNDH